MCFGCQNTPSIAALACLLAGEHVAQPIHAEACGDTTGHRGESRPCSRIKGHGGNQHSWRCACGEAFSWWNDARYTPRARIRHGRKLWRYRKVAS